MTSVERNDEVVADDLADFDRRAVTLLDVTKTVYVAGSGPAVIVMPEMPGISPHVARFARWIRDAGFTVYLPSLFGRDGAVPGADEGAAVFRRACVSAEFVRLRRHVESRHEWLRALARTAFEECGGPGVGAVGMCFTGDFALAMMLEPAVIAPVLAQPALPLDDPAALEISPAELRAVRERLDREGLTVLGYRFAGDSVLHRRALLGVRPGLGDRFIPRVLPDSAAKLEGAPPFFATHVNVPHSVLTVHLVDAEGEPTAMARDEIVAFLRARIAR